jgi:hypothetical protein
MNMQCALCGVRNEILGVFTNLQKATVSFVIGCLPHVCMSVRSDRTQQRSSHWKDFHECDVMSIFRKYVEKIQVSLQSDKTKGYCT